MADSLGALTFRVWLGPMPDGIRQSVQQLAHPGVDYEAYRFLGLRSPSIVRSSRADFASQALARAAYVTYAAAIEGGPYKLVFNDYDFDLENVRVIVKDVQVVYLERHLQICGAQTVGNTWDLECLWDLRFTPI